jgi:hypothetical protein
MEPLKVMVRTLDHPPPTLESLSKDRQTKLGLVVSTDKGLRDFVSKCLQKDPSKRQPVNTLLKHEFIKRSDRSKALPAKVSEWKLNQQAHELADEAEPTEWDLAKDFLGRELAKVPDVTVMNKPATSAIPNRIRGGSDGKIVSAWIYTNTESAMPVKPVKTIPEGSVDPPVDPLVSTGAAPAAPVPATQPDVASKVPASEPVPAAAVLTAPAVPTPAETTASAEPAAVAALVPEAPPAPVVPTEAVPPAPETQKDDAAAQSAAPTTAEPAAGMTGVAKMALRIEDPSMKGKVVDISFDFNFGKDTAEGIVGELCEGGFIGFLDAGQVRPPPPSQSQSHAHPPFRWYLIRTGQLTLLA